MMEAKEEWPGVFQKLLAINAVKVCVVNVQNLQ